MSGLGWMPIEMPLFEDVTYSDNVQATLPILYVPLSESSGAVATNFGLGGAARNGTYNGPTLAALDWLDGSKAPSFDGSNDIVDVYSASLAAAFNGGEMGIAFWLKVSAAADWTDGVDRRPFYFQADANNRVTLKKSAANNTFDWFYVAGGTSKLVQQTISPTVWTHVAVTISKAANRMRAYLNGAQVGSTLTGLGTWAGALNSATTLLGAAHNATFGNAWKGGLKHVAVWNYEPTPAMIASLYQVPT